ncbi:hypothetical protein [Aliirhizobium smilacinae]|uniref:Uncharacterized protein n=1 Tax=Aliirhizobium smilacinae TaxID=1395944 RepID=A0A5C4XCQ7_9HYPH|nr:hypothetical protein [Rhizobium smilacinae]TNM61283.1 hypothetical protein FHP24_22350 [Rhizobium smilacinae]
MGKFVMKDLEPPATGIRFTVGRDVRGRWIVNDLEGKVGGLFTDRASAVHFAMFESDHLPGAVWCLPDHVTLTLGEAFEPRRLHAGSSVARRA